MRLGPLPNAVEAHVSPSLLARRQPKRTVVHLLAPGEDPGRRAGRPLNQAVAYVHLG
jgi:hypothetical protein